MIRVDLAEFAEHLKKDKDKNYLVPVFSDLKRHDMGEFLNNESIEQDFQRRTAPLEKFIPTQSVDDEEAVGIRVGTPVPPPRTGNPDLRGDLGPRRRS